MATAYTSLLGFALPVTGELSGTWGDTVNNSITSLAEDAIAGTATAAVTSGDWTLTTTGSGVANQARCAILRPTGTPGVSRNIIAPSQSKAYIVVNQSNAAVVVKGSATTGVTVAAGTNALVAWNGSDFVLVAQDLVNAQGTLAVNKGGTGVTTSTGTGSVVLSTSPALTTPNLGTPSAATLTNATGLPIVNGTTGTLSVARGGTGATTLTGVVKGNGTSALTAGNVNLASEVTGTLPVANGGTGVTSSTGTGSVVLSTSPTLTTPNLGTPSAATLTNATGLPIVNGTTGTLSVARGGTGQTSYTNGELLIGNTTGNTLTKSTLTAGSGVSITNGAGSITIAATGSGGTVTSVGGTGTVNGISLSGTVTSSGNLTLGGALTGVNLGTQVTGTLPVANGGTGQTTYTNGQLLIGNTTGNTLTKANLTAGTGISITNGTGTISIAATNNGTVTSVASGTGLTGGPITSTGTLSVATNGISNTLLRDSAALSVIGRSANSVGDPADIAAASDHQVLRRSGTAIGFGATNLASTNAVTGILPVGNGGSGRNTLTANNVLLGNGTTAVNFVAPGTSGNVLTSNGTTWTSAAGGSASSIQEFTTSGTWTKPAGAQFVMVEAWGAGGGGGSGRRGAASENRVGGGGGGGGAYTYRLFNSSNLNATETVIIGAGGAGGAAITTNATDGLPGIRGGDTSFGNKLIAFGGSGGLSGTSSAGNRAFGGGVLGANGIPATGIDSGDGHFGSGGSGAQVLPSGFGGGAGDAAGTSGSLGGGSSYQGGPGGGGGGSINNGNAWVSGASGGGVVGARGTGAAPKGGVGQPGENGVGRQGASGGNPGNMSTIATLSVGHGNSLFAVTGSPTFNVNSSVVFTSTNGTSGWTARNTPVSISRLTHDGTRFVLINNNATRCFTTTDFNSYTEQNGLTSAVQVTRLKYVNGNYFITSTTALWRSTDLITWTQVSSGNGGQINDICWSGTNYLVTSSSTPQVRYSSDLTTWTTSTGTSNHGYFACASNESGTIIVQLNDPSTPIYSQISTDNGVSFTNITVGSQLNPATGGLAYFGTTWYMATQDRILTSTNGTSWGVRRSGQGELFGGGFASDGSLVIVGESSVTSQIVSTSSNVTTWDPRTFTAVHIAAGAGGTGGQPGGGGGGGGPNLNGQNSGAGGAGGGGLVRVYSW